MGIYKKEASWEEMKREASRRMELLKLEPQTVQEFEAGALYLSRQQGGQIALQPADEEARAWASQFEREYECLVYHALRADTPLAGACQALLFVSPASSDWDGERDYIKRAGLVYAYVSSELEDGVGEIMISPQNGGLIWLA